MKEDKREVLGEFGVANPRTESTPAGFEVVPQADPGPAVQVMFQENYQKLLKALEPEFQVCTGEVGGIHKHRNRRAD